MLRQSCYKSVLQNYSSAPCIIVHRQWQCQRRTKTLLAPAKLLKRQVSKTGRSVVAPKPSHSFVRDDAPHKGLKPLPDRRRPFRPKSATPSRIEEVARDGGSSKGRRRDRGLSSTSTASIPERFSLKNSDTSRNTSGPEKPQTRQWEGDQNVDEFFFPPKAVSFAAPTSVNAKSQESSKETSTSHLPTSFTSPPLLPGILQSLQEILGADAKPTAIQSLSIKYVLPATQNGHKNFSENWGQFLLASETGSGKSIAYLLPMLQGIKHSEHKRESSSSTTSPVASRTTRRHAPRGLVLAPTHELSRQLSSFAKSLVHTVKLRVMCASQANVKSGSGKEKWGVSSRRMARVMEEVQEGGEEGATRSEMGKLPHPVDLVVGTPMKLLDMVRGRGWDRESAEEVDELADQQETQEPRTRRRGRDFSPNAVFGTNGGSSSLDLSKIEWVVVDEADVLFDPDFQATTRLLLADISVARGHPVPLLSIPELERNVDPHEDKDVAPPTPVAYPFHLLFTSATIPTSLNAYLEKYHPTLIRLASPALHRLPKSLQVEHVPWSGGNKFADVLRRMKKVWAEDFGRVHGGKLSKILVFCNKSMKVEELCEYFETQGVKSVAMASASVHRRRGSNKHLAGFLKAHMQEARSESDMPSNMKKTETSGNVQTDPHVLVTTSLLSRGLDFSPEIKHVFIVDEPRNMIDFLHRAGRSGRAGQSGKVVVFGKMKGRGSERGREVKRRVGLLVG